MELEPVVEMEEDVCEESSSSSSGPPSLSPPPFGSDYWSEDSLYAGLAREHAELQRSHHALELRLKRSEARARAATERLQQLQAEAQELRELAELQEFRILELEGAGEHTAPARSPAPDTRDVCTDTENDDVSDSGVMSLPTSEDVASDSDLGVHDLKLELPPVPDLKEKILDAARALTNVEHKWTLHQAAALLDDAAAERAHRDADQLKQRLAQERRLREDLRGELQAKGEAMDAMQEALEDDISKLKSQISMLEKDNVQLSRDCDEMKQGVDKLQSLLKEQEELMVKEKERNEKALANLSNALAEKERDLQRVMSLARDEDVRSAQEELEEAEASQIHKSTDIESDDETCSPQYSTFPRTSREKTVLPPIKPPRRAKKMDVKKAKEAMANKSYSLELISNTQGHVESGFKGRNRSLQDISHEGVTNDYLISGQEKNERAPTPIPNPKREANSTKKAFIAYLPNSETNKCQMPSDNPCKPAIRGWRSQPESHRKPRWLTELSVRVNESSRNRPMSFPIKRSILYWDNINPKLQLKFSS